MIYMSKPIGAGISIPGEEAMRHDAEMAETAALHAEIRQCNWMIYITTWAVMALMFYFYTSVDYGFAVILLGIAWVHAMARYDFLIHRIGAFLRKSAHSLWEDSPQRRHQLWVLALADIGSALPIIYMYGGAVYTIWANGQHVWAVASVLYGMFGAFLLVTAATTHAIRDRQASSDGPVK